MRQQRAALVQHLQGQLVPRAEALPLGDARLGTPPPVLGPRLGQVEADIDQGVLALRDVAEVDAHLAVLKFAQPAAPLPRDAAGSVALLGYGHAVDDQHPGRVADLGGDVRV